jgi:hypothetical protein
MSWVTIIWAMIASAAVAEGIPNPWMLIGQLPFSPDDRTKKILTEAVALANATSGSLFMNPREADWYYYPGSAWFNPLFISAMGRRLTSS